MEVTITGLDKGSLKGKCYQLKIKKLPHDIVKDKSYMEVWYSVTQAENRLIVKENIFKPLLLIILGCKITYNITYIFWRVVKFGMNTNKL